VVVRLAVHLASAVASIRQEPPACACRARQAWLVAQGDCRLRPGYSDRGGSVCPPVPPGGVRGVCRAWHHAPVPGHPDGWACQGAGSGMDDPTEGPGGCRPGRSGVCPPVGACCRRRHQAGWVRGHRGVRALQPVVAAGPRGGPVRRRWGARACALEERQQGPSTRSPGQGGQGPVRRGVEERRRAWQRRGELAAPRELQGVPAGQQVWRPAEPALRVEARERRAWRRPELAWPGPEQAWLQRERAQRDVAARPPAAWRRPERRPASPVRRERWPLV
jgi:hypothetical protein